MVQFIVDYAAMKAQALQKNIKFALVSNLTLMDEDKLKWLLDHGVDICTSLDGGKETHNWQRTWKEGNSYERVTHWIGRINAEQEIR